MLAYRAPIVTKGDAKLASDGASWTTS